MHDVSSSSEIAAAHLGQAVSAYARLGGDPEASLTAAVREDGDFLLAHAARGFIAALSVGGSGIGLPVVEQSLSSVRRLLKHESPGIRSVTLRERAYALAFVAWTAGRRRAAAALLEGALLRAPTDLLALRTVHDVHFYNGDANALRAGPARALQAWDPSMPGYGHVLGMLAFGLQECGQYDSAESAAMQALNLDPTDAWATHAAAHVYEATARRDEGKRFLGETQEHWAVRPPSSPGSTPAGATLLEHHLLWHWCLLDIGCGEARHALSRYDNRMAARGSGAAHLVDVLSRCDDASLLWRIELARSPLARLPGDDSITAAAAGADDPSAALSSAYLAHVEEPADASSPGRAATRWTVLARHLGNAVARPIAAFTGVQVAMALAAAGDDLALSRHLSSMEEFAGSAHAPLEAQVLPRASTEGVAALPQLWASQLPAAAALGASVRLRAAATAQNGIHGRDNSEDRRLIADALGAAADEAPDAGIADDVVVTALAGIDLARGMARFWRASRGGASHVDGASLLPPASLQPSHSPPPLHQQQPPPSWVSALSRAIGGGTSSSLVTSSSTPPPMQPRAHEPSSGPLAGAAGAEARAALQLLLRSRPYWSLLGCSHAQRDVFEQTLIHAAVAAGDGTVASTLASERVTLLFADPQAWNLLGAVLEAFGEPTRAADARNKAYALGLGSRGSG